MKLCGVLAGALLLAGCSGGRTLRFESSVPASVEDSGGKTLCAPTPCSWRVSRETCGVLDSSSGYLRVSAVASDGARLDAPPLKTCAVLEGTLVRFRFAGSGAPEGRVDVLSRETKP
ncbi:MAG: hypothetical protein HY923_04955 [Elusimicrobia bacterium]|nr:hypothetical protein [Elusimicrobiota bacterium]